MQKSSTTDTITKYKALHDIVDGRKNLYASQGELLTLVLIKENVVIVKTDKGNTFPTTFSMLTVYDPKAEIHSKAPDATVLSDAYQKPHRTDSLPADGLNKKPGDSIEREGVFIPQKLGKEGSGNQANIPGLAGSKKAPKKPQHQTTLF